LTTINSPGRLNIYALFIEYALTLLRPGGEMVYLIPTSINTGAYFSTVRQYILENAVIKSIEIVEKSNDYFVDAQTPLQIIHLQKTQAGFQDNFRNSLKYIVDWNELSY